MNILQALFFSPDQPGGVSSMVPHIHQQFNEQGWSMALFALPRRLRNKGQGEVQFSTFDWKQFDGNAVVKKYIQTLLDYEWWTKYRLKESYDLIHAHHPIAALVMKKLYPQTPVLLTIHSSYENELILNHKIEENSEAHQFLLALYRELEATVDGIVTVSQAFRKYLTPFVEKPEKIVVIPNGFDPKRFRPIAHDNVIPQLVTLGRLVPAKGMDVLLQACAELKRRGHEFVLHMIGDGPNREQLEQHAQELDIYDETIFYGYLLHPEQFMPFFDIFVLPSRAEAFGNVFAEAALCWSALVGTDVGGIPEQIEHGKNGLLVPVDDVEALADSLERLIRDPALRQTLAEAAYEKAIKEYSLERVIGQLKVLYRQFGQKSDVGG